MIILFWISLFLIFYAFLGYGILLYIIIIVKRILKGKDPLDSVQSYPSCTVIVAAYNEEKVIEEKIKNTLSLNYPEGLIKYIFISDGSDDNTKAITESYSGIISLFQPLRKGKVAAIKRAMQYAESEIVVFTDANTLLNPDSLMNICRHYQREKIGAVAGEKRVKVNEKADATVGEGFYWKYESKLKQWDSELNTVVGAAGELFSIRTCLYEPVRDDTILDDFMLSMKIAEKGRLIVYEPEAYAMETASENISEELKRKVRIAAGGIQSVLRLKKALNPFKFPVLAFQYISHRVLRWTVVPFLLILVLILNLVLLNDTGHGELYKALFTGQLIFYLLAFSGFVFERKKIHSRVFFIPYYFCLMNYAVIAGIVKFISGRQTVLWEKAKRSEDCNIR